MSITRYTSLNTTTNQNGQTVYSTTLPKKIEPDITDATITAKQGDRLDELAFKFYGDPSLWWVIAEVNGLSNGGLAIVAGTQILIPDSSRIPQ